MTKCEFLLCCYLPGIHTAEQPKAASKVTWKDPGFMVNLIIIQGVHLFVINRDYQLQIVQNSVFSSHKDSVFLCSLIIFNSFAVWILSAKWYPHKDSYPGCVFNSNPLNKGFLPCPWMYFLWYETPGDESVSFSPALTITLIDKPAPYTKIHSYWWLLDLPKSEFVFLFFLPFWRRFKR